ncbi:MAG: hypothetical protein AAF658_16030, partial [Myxococcota bacterium]
MTRKTAGVIVSLDASASLDVTVSSLPTDVEVTLVSEAPTRPPETPSEGFDYAKSMGDALERHTGHPILFLSAGDQLEPGALERMLACLDQEPTATVVAGYAALERGTPYPRVAGEASIIPGDAALQRMNETYTDWREHCVVLVRASAATDCPITRALEMGDLIYLPHAMATRQKPTERSWTPSEASRALPLAPRPLFPIPWWSDEARRAAEQVTASLETRELPTALAELAATEDAEHDLALRLL